MSVLLSMICFLFFSRELMPTYFVHGHALSHAVIIRTCLDRFLYEHNRLSGHLFIGSNCRWRLLDAYLTIDVATSLTRNQNQFDQALRHVCLKYRRQQWSYPYALNAVLLRNSANGVVALMAALGSRIVETPAKHSLNIHGPRASRHAKVSYRQTDFRGVHCVRYRVIGLVVWSPYTPYICSNNVESYRWRHRCLCVVLC